MKKLNLGSGGFYKDGYVNVDLSPAAKPDVIHDLGVVPYPFADDEFDLVEADHCLEHLPDPFAAMREIHRITRNGGAVRIRVPHFSRGFSHPDHKSGFDITFPYYFRKDFRGYEGVEFHLDHLRLSWFAPAVPEEDGAAGTGLPCCLGCGRRARPACEPLAFPLLSPLVLLGRRFRGSRVPVHGSQVVGTRPRPRQELRLRQEI